MELWIVTDVYFVSKKKIPFHILLLTVMRLQTCGKSYTLGLDLTVHFSLIFQHILFSRQTLLCRCLKQNLSLTGLKSLSQKYLCY